MSKRPVLGREKAFEQLTLSESTRLFCHPRTWTHYGKRHFSITPKALGNLLNIVREIRNPWAHFRGNPSLAQRRQLKFAQLWFKRIEELLGSDLPKSAREHRAWWANDTVSHSWSKDWLDVDWRVASVNMSNQTVRFDRIKERQRAYIDFFSVLINDLRQQPGFDYLQNSSDGVNWYWTRSVTVHDRSVASFNYSFGRGSIFRVELYIDTGTGTINKQIYNALLAQKEGIETEVGHELTWQRLDHRRASRIAHIFKGHITDSEEELAELRQKAIPAMINYVKVMQPRVEAAGKEVL